MLVGRSNDKRATHLGAKHLEEREKKSKNKRLESEVGALDEKIKKAKLHGVKVIG